jgi:hypothetical protein
MILLIIIRSNMIKIIKEELKFKIRIIRKNLKLSFKTRKVNPQSLRNCQSLMKLKYFIALPDLTKAHMYS